MCETETSGKDNEPNSGTADRSPSKEPSHATRAVPTGGVDVNGIINSTGKRDLIVIIIIVVIAIAIFGVAFTIVRESQKEKKDSSFENDDPHFSFGRNESHAILDQDEVLSKVPFKIEVPLFTPDVREPYASVGELRNDIETLAKTFANTIILKEGKDSMYKDDTEVWLFDESVKPAFAADMALKGSASSSQGSSELFSGVEDFETYEHERGVVKNNLVKYNGEHVFAANKNRVIVWDLEGNLSETTHIHSKGTDKTAINIVAMLMNPDGDMLTVISSDYGQYNYENEDVSIISFNRETQVTTFKVQGSTLTEVSQAYIGGYHVESYSFDDNVQSLQEWC